MELFSIKLNCEGVKTLFLFTNFVIFVSIIFSNTLEKTERREIGQKSPSDLRDETLATGTTYAILNESGKVSSFMHLLNNFVSTRDKIQLEIFTNLEGISLMPCAELVLMLLIQALTYIMFSHFMKNKRIQAAFIVNFERRIISWCDVFGQRGTNSGKIITELVQKGF